MLIEEKYTDLSERKEKIILSEGKGLRMLYDNFDSDWKPGDEPHGVMIFTDEVETKTINIPVRDLASELDVLKSEVAALQAAK